MPLNQVQINHVNENVRRGLEAYLQAIYTLRAVKDDYDALQSGPDALPTDSTVLDDNAAGDGPRPDAPTMTGANAAALMTHIQNTLDQITPAQEEVMLQFAKRTKARIQRIQLPSVD